MKRKLSTWGSVFLFAALLTGCSDDKDDEGTIDLKNPEEQTQTAYADENSTGGFTFTATSPWTASVSEVTSSSAALKSGLPVEEAPKGFASSPEKRKRLTDRLGIAKSGEPVDYPLVDQPTKSSGVSWLKLLYNGEEAYSGGAGTYTLTIQLEANYTGATRKAEITIRTGGDRIVISVEQAGKTETGEVPVNPGGDGESKLITRIYSQGDYIDQDGEKVGSYSNDIRFTYDEENRVIKIKATDKETYHSSNYLTEYEETYTYSGNKVDVVSVAREDGETYSSSASLTFGDQGYVVSGTGRYTSEWDLGWWDEDNEEYGSVTVIETSDETYVPSYSDGYLTGLVTDILNTVKGHPDYGNYNYPSKENHTLTWSGGNLSGHRTTYWENNPNYEEYTSGPYTTSLTSGSGENKANLDLNWLVYSGEWLGTMDSHGMTVFGKYGKKSKNLVSRELADEAYEGGDKRTYNYKWTLDAAGYPTSVTISQFDADGDSDWEEVLNFSYNR